MQLAGLLLLPLPPASVDLACFFSPLTKYRGCACMSICCTAGCMQLADLLLLPLPPASVNLACFFQP
jgi:hypothetical protein